MLGEPDEKWVFPQKDNAQWFFPNPHVPKARLDPNAVCDSW